MSSIMEELIKRILCEHDLDKITLSSLIDFGDEIDDDGDVISIVANTIGIDEEGRVILYDDRDEDENGVIEPIVFFNTLDIEMQNKVMFSLEYTLKTLQK